MTGPAGGREEATDPAAGHPAWRWRSAAGELVLVAVGYYAAARLSLRLSLVDEVVTPIWPPTGIALVALLAFGSRVWPAISVAAFFVNAPIAGWVPATVIASGNTLAPLLAVRLLRGVGFRRELDRLRDALALVALGALAAMTVSATFGAGALFLAGVIPADAVAATWSVWWAGDATGILIFAPLLLSIRRPGRWSGRRVAEAVVVLLVLAASAYLGFRTTQGRPYLLFPFIIWATVRFGQQGAAVAALVVMGMAVWAAIDQAGPFTDLTLLGRALTLQVYNAGAALTSFLLAAVMTERQKAQAALEEARARLEETFRQAPAVFAVLRGPRHMLEFANPAFQELVGSRARAGSPIGEVLPELATQGQLQLLDDVLRTGEAYVAREARLCFSRSGTGPLEEAYFNLAYQPLRGEDGEVDGVLIHAVEVTGTVRAREEVQALLERERRIAETLQRSLLPQQLPRIPGVALAGRYLPGAAGLEIGGDWYDVFLLPGGRVGLTIGDVVGRGLTAAASMGQLRTGLRAYALEAASPAAVLERLNRLVQELQTPEIATMVYAVLDPETGRLTYAVAGHPRPLLAAADGTVRYLEGEGSPPLGVPGEPCRDEVVTLEPGSTLLLYTDGLVERRDRSIDDGLEALRATMSGPPDDLDALCDDRILGILPPDAPADDVAVLALRFVSVAGDELDLLLPAEPAVLASLRRALGQWLTGLGGTPDDVHDIVLACNEAATNVLEHAYGPGDGFFEVKCRHSAGTVELTVRDFGRWRSPRGDERGRGLLLIHALVDSLDIIRGPSGTEVHLGRQLGRREDAADASLAAAPSPVIRTPPSQEQPLVKVVQLYDDIDVSNAEQLRTALLNAVSNEALGLVLDLTEARRIDSAGVRLLFQLAARLGQRRQQLAVVVPEDSPIRRVLLLTKVETAARLTSTVDQAIALTRTTVEIP
jgi:anti-anti-sigma factor